MLLTFLTITQPLLAQSTVVGGDVTFSVAITGHPPPFGYEWRKLSPSTLLASNESSARLAFHTLTNVQANQAGSYPVIVRNAASTSGVASTVTLVVLTDSDGNGMPDAWETAYPAAAEPTQDTDGDGLTNLEEYRAGTDPTKAASVLRIDRLTAGNSATLEFSAVSNKTYTVQHADRGEGGLWSKLADMVARATNHTEMLTDLVTAMDVQILHQPDQRDDPRQRHRHRWRSLLWLHQPDQHHDPRQSH